MAEEEVRQSPEMLRTRHEVSLSIEKAAASDSVHRARNHVAMSVSPDAI